MTQTNDKLRAVFFASLMVLWVFAGAVAFGGSAAALDTQTITASGSASSTTAGETATYTIDISPDGPVDTDIQSAEIDLSDANSNGVDASGVTASDITVEYDNSTANPTENGTLNVENVTAQSDTVQFDFVTITNATENGDSIIITIDGIQNPGAGDGTAYTFNADLFSDFGQSGDTASDSFNFGGFSAPTGGSNNLPSYADTTWVTGDIRYVGQTLALFTNSSGNSDYRIHATDYEAAQQVKAGTQLAVRSDGTIRIRTSSKEGDYIVTEGDGSGTRQQITTNSNGVQNGVAATGLGSANGSAVVSIQAHEIQAQFVDEDEDELDEVRLDETFDMLITGNRNDYTLEVTSSSLNNNDLEDLLGTADGFDSDSFEEGDDGEVLVSGVNADYKLTNLSFDEAGLSEGEYTLDLAANDTAASTSATINVTGESDDDANFDQAVFQGYRGDFVKVSLTTDSTVDEVNVTVGDSDDQGYEAYFNATPNSDDKIEFKINTYLVGNKTGDESDAYEMIEGSMGDNGVEMVSGDFSRVLESGSYDVSVNSVPENGESEELDLASIEVADRYTGNVTVHRGPAGSSKYSDLTDTDSTDSGATIPEGIRQYQEDGLLTETEEVALNDDPADGSERSDVVVYEVDVSGVFGALSAADEGVYAPPSVPDLELEQENPPPNQDEVALNTSDAASTKWTAIHVAQEQKIYYVTNPDSWEFENGDTVSAIEDGDVYNATYNVSGDYRNDFSRDDLEAGDDDELTFGLQEFVDRELEFDTSGGEVIVSNSPDQTVTGSTTVAPGTELRVRARSTGDQAFLKTAETKVDANGNFEAVFSDRDSFEDVAIGRNFTASVPQQSFEEDAETDGQVTAGETASVTLSDVSATEGEEVGAITVDSANLPRGGFVTIHDGSLNDGATFDSVRGTSDYLSEGENTDIEISLDSPYTEDGEAIAMAHVDSDSNQEYDFVDSQGDNDGPYTDDSDEAVTDSASVTFESETTETTDTETETSTSTSTSTDETESTDDQPGFGIGVALVALLGAALLAARRNAF